MGAEKELERALEEAYYVGNVRVLPEKEEKVTLYDILEAEREFEEIESLSDEAKTEYYQSIQAQKENKIDSTVRFVQETRGKADMVENEIRRLSALKAFYNNRADRLESGMTRAMEVWGIERIETGFTKVYFRGTPAVLITDEGKIPANFFKEKITLTPDKTAIKEAIKSGKRVEGAEIVINKSIQIK